MQPTCNSEITLKPETSVSLLPSGIESLHINTKTCEPQLNTVSLTMFTDMELLPALNGCSPHPGPRNYQSDQAEELQTKSSLPGYNVNGEDSKDYRGYYVLC